MIRIRAKIDGFRRCGVAHPATPTDHPGGRFTPDELERLQAEPELVVEILPEPSPLPLDGGGAGGEGDSANAQADAKPKKTGVKNER